MFDIYIIREVLWNERINVFEHKYKWKLLAVCWLQHLGFVVSLEFARHAVLYWASTVTVLRRVNNIIYIYNRCKTAFCFLIPVVRQSALDFAHNVK